MAAPAQGAGIHLLAHLHDADRALDAHIRDAPAPFAVGEQLEILVRRRRAPAD